MKNVLLGVFALCTTVLFAQEYQWTSYNFSVANEDAEIVGKIVGDYFGEEGSKNEGVSVFLFENHFNDNSINYTHSIVFTGTLDAMGAQYNREPNPKWDLFLAKLNQFTENHSSGAGTGLISFGEPGSHPVQNIYWLDVKDPQKFAAAFSKYNKKYNPSDRRVTLGNFGLGNDLKTAFNTSLYRKNNKAAQAAWDEYWDNAGEVNMVRSTTRVMLGKW